MRESFLVDGVAFKKTFSYAGFEQQPKYFDNPTVLALNLELELKSENANAHSRGTSSVAYNNDGTRIVSACYGGTIKVWDSGAFWASNRFSFA